MTAQEKQIAELRDSVRNCERAAKARQREVFEAMDRHEEALRRLADRREALRRAQEGGAR